MPGGSQPIEGFHFEPRVPEGDDRERLICRDCGWIHYVNPHVVVGAVCASGDQVLLCRRAIEPRRGFWTLPAGYLEQGETVEEGAMREAREEANAHIEIDRLLGLYSVPHISQVQLIFRARLVSPAVSAGPESLEVGLFRHAEIPWGELAFPTVRWSLIHHRDTLGRADFAPFTGPPPAEAER